MTWELLRDAYHNFDVATARARIVTAVASEVLRDFPNRLPPQLRAEVEQSVQSLLRAFREAAPATTRERQPSRDDPAAAVKPFPSPASGTLRMFGSYLWAKEAVFEIGTYGRGFEAVDFPRLLQAQELVIIVAHLEAFLQAAVHAVYRQRPDLVVGQRQVDAATVLRLGSWEAVQDYFAQEAAREMTGSRRSLVERIRTLAERLELPALEDGLLEELDRMAQLRHVLVHSGGRATSEYVKRTGWSGGVGEPVALTDELVERAGHLAMRVVNGLASSIAERHYGKDLYAIGVTRSFVLPEESNHQ